MPLIAMLGDTKPYKIAQARKYSLEKPMQNYFSGGTSIGYNLSEIIEMKYELMYKPKH